MSDQEQQQQTHIHFKLAHLKRILRSEWKPYVDQFSWGSMVFNPHRRAAKFVTQYIQDIGHFDRAITTALNNNLNNPVFCWTGFRKDGDELFKYLCITIRLADMHLSARTQWIELSADPRIFRDSEPLMVMYIWTHCKTHVLYRLPLDLIHVICDFI